MPDILPLYAPYQNWKYLVQICIGIKNVSLAINEFRLELEWSKSVVRILLETVWKPNFQSTTKMKAPEITGASLLQIGGGGGNRTRVREPFGRASTYIFCDLISSLRTPTGRIPKGPAYKIRLSPYKLRGETILFFWHPVPSHRKEWRGR